MVDSLSRAGNLFIPLRLVILMSIELSWSSGDEASSEGALNAKDLLSGAGISFGLPCFLGICTRGRGECLCF